MAYRFDGTDDKVEFAIAPFNGYAMGPATFAIFLKRSAVGVFRYVVSVTQSGSDVVVLLITNPNLLGMYRNGGTSTGPSVSSTSPWYLLVVTFAATAPRFHIHDGTSWTHANGSGSMSVDFTFTGTSRLAIGDQAVSGVGAPFAGDVVCAGIKKADSSDAAVETLSRTAFQAWRDFGFDWLIGFDSSQEAAGILQDQASPGTGDEIAITGTTAVADPPGWSWAGAPAAAFVPQIMIA